MTPMLLLTGYEQFVTRCVTGNARLSAWREMAKTFGTTVRKLREAQELSLRRVAGLLGITPGYLSRIERRLEKPPAPRTIKKMAALFGVDPDLLFRLSDTTDPDLAEYLNVVPNVAKFLRVAIERRLTAEDFAALIEQVKRTKPVDG